MLKKRWVVLISLLMVGALLAACGPSADEAAARISDLESQLAEAQQAGAAEDVAALEAQLAEAQAALEAAEAGEEAMPSYSVTLDDPETITNLVIGEPETLDTAITYESAGINITRNLYDGLVFFEGSAVDQFVPFLATDWTESDDGLTLTFTIREGVTFHAGGTLEPHDVAYTFHRNLLLGWDFLEMGGPMGLFFDPFFSGLAPISQYGIGAAGDGGLLDAAGGDDVALCELVQSAVVADDEAGTVTFHLAYPAGYFFQLLAQPWAGVQDMEWMVEQGAWDGDCNTWRDWYAPDVSGTNLYDTENGTGPYMLDHWTPGDEIVLTANPNWWVTEPLWEGSTIDGAPEIDTVVVRLVEEWGTRLATVQAGDADFFDAEMAYSAQTEPLVRDWTEYDTGETTTYNPGGILRMVHGLPETSSGDMFFNFIIDTTGGNPWIGSGALDGAGIPADFFSDIHVRRGWNYCFDRDTFIEEVRQGESIPHRGPIIEGMLGYTADSFIYPYDLDLCAQEMEQAWDGQVWENGFLVTIAYNSGNDSRRIAAEILRDNLAAVNDGFQVVVADMPWPTYLAERRAARLPLHYTGWIEDFHHPHNWVVPYMSCSGDFSGRQAFPEEMCGPWDTLIAQAVRLSGTDPDAAGAIYEQLQSEAMDNAIDIFIHQPTVRHYEQLWVHGWYFHPMFGANDPYYASLWMEAE
jgi:peptide/nickel transport system substrate-binding protein